jgi:predicted ArsR family transcriptional regulator
VAEAARAGSRTLTALRQAADKAETLAADQHGRSRLPDVLEQLLRTPAVTAGSLARTLAITPQAALRILERLVAAGMATEVTGRKSFQAFAAAMR